MKTYFACIFLLAATTCFAADPAVKSYAISVSYVDDGKNVASASSENLSEPEVTLPLNTPNNHQWMVRISCDNESGQIHVTIFDASLPSPPQSGTAPIIFDGGFALQSGKPQVVLKTAFYSLTVTVTVPDRKKIEAAQ